MQEHVKVGRVLKYVPAYNYYRVHINGSGNIRSGVLAQGGAGLAGTRANFTIPPNSLVLVYDVTVDSPETNLCYIIGAITPITTDAGLMPADQDIPASGAGFLHDAVFNYPTATDPAREDAIQAGNQTSIDALPGEYTISNPLGPALHVGYFMAQLRASDRAAIQMFRDGELVRVLGKSYQLHTFAEETEHTAQEGEINVTRKVALLPWEALGAFSQDQPTAKVSEQKQADTDAPPTESKITTKEDGQRPIYRYQEYTGYLGDVYHRFVDLPLGEGGLDKYGEGQDLHQGVFHEHIGADGSYTLQSAKSITLERWNLIPVPLVSKDPADPSGDTAQDYRPSGVLGEGPENPREDFAYADRDDAAAHGMLGLELHGFAADKMGLANLRAHKKNYQVAEEADTPFALDPGGAYPDYTLDPELMWMPLPKYREVTVQQGRWEKVKYYGTRSAIQQLDDGTVVLEDGYGSQIVMGGGNIRITCPGDVLLLPGRSLIGLAPQDAIIRAGNSADITAAKKDVRIKAERNLEIIGANSGDGGILIESRDNGQEFDFSVDGEGKNIQGLVLKNKNGQIASLSKDLALCGLEGGTAMVQARGDLVLRGNTARLQSAGDVTLVSAALDSEQSTRSTSYVFGSTSMNLGVGESIQINLSASSVSVLGSMTVYGSLGVANSTTIGGSVSTAGAITSTSSTILPMSQDARRQMQNTFANSRAIATAQFTTSAQILATAQQKLDELLRAERYFNDALVGTAVTASLRTEQDYHTETDKQFILPEARWQQYARTTGAGNTWEEPEVQGSTVATAPWPGVAPWSQDARLLQYTEQNFSVQDGISTSGQEEKKAIVPLTTQVLSQAYLVNSRA